MSSVMVASCGFETAEFRYQCILADDSTAKPHTELGLEGTFEVQAS